MSEVELRVDNFMHDLTNDSVLQFNVYFTLSNSRHWFNVHLGLVTSIFKLCYVIFLYTIIAFTVSDCVHGFATTVHE